jgi:hypothetical protein
MRGNPIARQEFSLDRGAFLPYFVQAGFMPKSGNYSAMK